VLDPGTCTRKKFQQKVTPKRCDYLLAKCIYRDRDHDRDRDRDHDRNRDRDRDRDRDAGDWRRLGSWILHLRSDDCR
jgi:hypothetical protein